MSKQLVGGCLTTAGLILVAAVGHADEVSRLAVVPLSEELRTRCLEIFRGGLASDEFWPSIHAAEALTIAGHGDEVRSRLSGRIAGEADHQRRCGLAREVVRAGDRRPLAVLFETLGDARSNGRIHAAESLYKLGEIGDGRLIRNAAGDSNAVLQMMAAAALARCGDPASLQKLRDFVEKAPTETRGLAAWAIGLLGSAQDIPALRQAHAQVEMPATRAFIAHALACLQDPAGREELGKNLNSEDAALRVYAAEFCGYCRASEFRDRLVRLLDDTVLDVRVRAAQALVMLSQRPDELPLPVGSGSRQIIADVYPATPQNPRYSEGSMLALRDGSILFATTEFIGAGEDHSTARIVARTTRDGGRTWDAPRVLQPNVGRQNVMSVTLRRLPPAGENAPIGMFYLVTNSSDDLKAWLRISTDEAQTFGEPILVTNAPGYHVLNNDRITMLKSGRLVCPVAWAADVVKDGHFQCFCFLSDDGGRTWRAGTDKVDQPQRGAMEPEVVELADGKLMMIIRTQLGIIATSISADGGDHWSSPAQLPVQSPESPATIRRIPATGDLLLIWNNTFQKGSGHGGKRTPLTIATSADNGKTWKHVRNLETSTEHAYAYTSVLFHQDRVLLGYYVEEQANGRISSRFRSFPVRELYLDQAPVAAEKGR